MVRRIAYLIFIFPLFAVAQKKDTVYLLKEVDISAHRPEVFGNGYKLEKIDSTYLNNLSAYSLAELLAQQSGIYIKSYGSGQVSSPSLRGAGAAHTAVLWNGLNLQSPLHGQSDLSLIPNEFLDEVKIQPGGAGGLYGSGAIGGAVHLDNKIKFNQGLNTSLTTSYGSFNNLNEQLRFEYGSKNFISSTRVFNHDLQNNFPYNNYSKPSSPLSKQSNAEIKEQGLLQENHFKWREVNIFSLRIWYQNTDRNVPASIAQAYSNANQKDEFFRLMGEWERKGSTMDFNFRTAYFDEQLKFADPSSDIDSKSRSKNYINEVETKWKIGTSQFLDVGINNTFATAVSTGFLSEVNRNQLAFFSMYKWTNTKKTFTGTISLREEIFNKTLIPVTPGIGLEWTLIKNIKFKGNVSRVYRVPTFNDLYWLQGGNPDLIPESGWSEEAGISHRISRSVLRTDFDITFFNSKLDNWIIWLPTASFWTPQNIMQVWARGVETRFDINYKFHNVGFHFNAGSNYVLSTNEKTKSESDASLNKQLIYVPQYKVEGNFGILYKSYYINFNYSYTGYRYTTSDNTEFLKPFQLGNISFSKTFSFRTVELKAFVQMNNIWKAQYEMVQGYPLPMNNYLVGLTLKINQPINPKP